MDGKVMCPLSLRFPVNGQIEIVVQPKSVRSRSG
jgi:hypothetical protein